MDRAFSTVSARPGEPRAATLRALLFLFLGSLPGCETTSTSSLSSTSSLYGIVGDWEIEADARFKTCTMTAEKREGGATKFFMVAFNVPRPGKTEPLLVIGSEAWDMRDGDYPVRYAFANGSTGSVTAQVNQDYVTLLLDLGGPITGRSFSTTAVRRIAHTVAFIFWPADQIKDFRESQWLTLDGLPPGNESVTYIDDLTPAFMQFESCVKKIRSGFQPDRPSFFQRVWMKNMVLLPYNPGL